MSAGVEISTRHPHEKPGMRKPIGVRRINEDLVFD
jgi:hypothetical protein